MPLFTRRRLVSGFAAFGAVAGIVGLRSATARYYDGPVSDHFDGTRFFDVAWLAAEKPGRPCCAGTAIGGSGADGRHGRRAPMPTARPRGSKAATGASPMSGHATLLLQTARAQHPDRPGVVGAGFARELRRAQACQRSRHRFRRVAADRRRAGVALPLRPSRRRHAVAPGCGASPARDHAARQRHHHARP